MNIKRTDQKARRATSLRQQIPNSPAWEHPELPEFALDGMPEQLRQLISLRMELELFALRQSIGKNPKIGKDARSTFSGLILELRKATLEKDYESFSRLDRNLHFAIIQLANFQLLDQVWERVWHEVATFHDETLQSLWPDLRVLMAEHDYLVKAICSGDLAAAEDGMRHHLEAIWFRLAERQNDFMLDAEPLQRATSFLAFNYNRAIKLPDVARKVAFCSEGHLSKLFRQHFGKGFQSYLLDLRLEKASELLRETRLPVGEIARRVGYSDLPRFGQHFKRKYKLTPSAWKMKSG
jgi:AraC-like DNA-binding protein